MKILKIIGIVIALLIALIVVGTLVTGTEFEAERSVVIDRPSGEVFEFVRYLENQNSYSVWVQRNPDMHIEYRGTDGSVGAVSAWEGNEESGKGEQEIVGMVEGERIDFELRFYEPFESTSYAFKSTEPINENQTRVTWGMSGSVPRPLNLLLLFYDMGELIGEDYETGLNNLKTILEAQPDEP